jgi:uncharacterized tellurite resistance protein B-like protein
VVWVLTGVCVLVGLGGIAVALGALVRPFLQEKARVAREELARQHAAAKAAKAHNLQVSRQPPSPDPVVAAFDASRASTRSRQALPAPPVIVSPGVIGAATERPSMRLRPPEVPRITISFTPSPTVTRRADPAAGRHEWLGPGQALTAGGIRIPDPLTYRVNVPAVYMDRTEPSAIIPSMPVARNATDDGAQLPYWPRYSGLTPSQRLTYLTWMAGGRATLPPQIGYAFIFFYGLERRALMDAADHAIIFNEVFRLRTLNSQQADGRFNHSFESYTSSLLWYMVFSFPTNVSEESIRKLMETTRSWNEDTLSAALAWFILTQRRLPTWAAYVVAGQLPASQRSVVVLRVGNQFRTLFEKRYAEQFGDGMEVQSSKRTRTYWHRPGNATLPPVERSGPNPIGLSSQFKDLSDIWNGCIEDLRRLSSVVGKGEQKEVTPEAWAAMPPEIRAGVEHPLTGAVCRVMEASTDAQGQTRIPVRRLAEALSVAVGERLTVRDSRRLGEIAEQVGYGLEPDARLTGKAYRSDEELGAFLRTTGETPDAARYNAAACMLHLGLVAAAADGNIDPREAALVTDTIRQMFQLNTDEQRRLEVRRALLVASGADTTGLSHMAKALSPEQKQAVAKLLLLVVAVDGVVTKQEVKALTRCYNLLGFSKDETQRALVTIESYRTDEPVTIQAGGPAAGGEAIPAAPPEGLRLNRAAIEAIMRDTEEVAKMLAAAMNAGESAEATSPATQVPAPSAPTPPPAAADTAPAAMVNVPTDVRLVPDALTDPVVVNTSDPTLPQRYAAFYQMLVTRSEWSRAELDALARQHGLMLSGAIDALNDWSFEKYGGQLFVDDGPRFLVQREYLS